MSLTRAKFLAYLYERWCKPDAIMQALVADCPLLGMINKVKAGGKYYHVPILQRGPVGASATYATAKSGASGSTTVGFDVTYTADYQVLLIDGNLLDAAQGSDNAIAEALDHEMEGGIANMQKRMRHGLYHNHGGAIGQVDTYVASALTLTLTNPEDSVHFEEGMELEADTTDGTSGAKHAGSFTLTAIDRDTGTLTSDAAIDGQIAAIADDDYLFPDDDFGLRIYGLLDWIPATAPGATSFFGVDRSVDTQRLGGIRYTGTGMPLETAMLNAVARAQLYGAKIDAFLCTPLKWAEVSNSIGADAQNRRVQVEGSTTRGAKVGYDAIMIATPMGFKPLIADPGCPKKYIFALDMSTWDLAYVGDDVVRLIDDDGLRMRRGTGDDWLAELKFYGQPACRAPGRNVIITVES